MKKGPTFRLARCLTAVIAIVSLLHLVRPVFALPEPTVVTGAATNITSTTATLNGTASDAGDSPISSRGFNYGSTVGYGNTVDETVAESFEYVSQFGSSSSGDGELYNPYGIAIDSLGNVYVADSTNYRVQKFNSSGVYQSQFGSSGSGNGQFSSPQAIAFDGSNNIYIVDRSNNRVQKFNSSGVYQSQFGTGGWGNGQFQYPIGITINTADEIFILERNNPRVQKFNSSGVYQSQFGAQGSGDGQLSYPQGIAMDNTGNIYISDGEDHRLQKFNSSGVYQSQFGHDIDNDQLYSPYGITIDSNGDILIVDTDNHQVNRFNSSGVYQSQFGSYGSGNGKFFDPSSAATDGVGNIYVTDSLNNRVQKFNSSGVYQSQFGTGGSGNGQFHNPQDIAIDSDGNIYVADPQNHRVQKFNSSGVYQSQFGSYGSGNGQFSYPDGVAIDSMNNIYVVDPLNHRVQKFNSSGVYQSQFGGYGSGNGQLNYPQGIAIDSENYIYISDQVNSRFQKFNSSGVYQSKFVYSSGGGQLYNPRDIAVDNSGNVYLLNGYGSTVQKYTLTMNEGAFSTSITGLTCGTTYHYQAYANNDDGSTEADDETFTTSACPEPDPPMNLVAAANSSSSINISWDAPSHTGDSPIAAYMIKYQKVGDSDWIFLLTNDSDTTYSLYGLESSTAYAIKIQSRNTNNLISIDSTQVAATTDAYVSPNPDPPTNLQATISSSTAINVTWDAPVNTGDSPILNYYILYQKVGDNYWDNYDPGDNETSAEITNLMPSTQYNIKAVARNSNYNNSADSETISATTGTPGFYLISNCHELQNIRNDLLGNYELAKDIDCTETINWNGGSGFVPIGNFFDGTFFSGILAGNNYTISGLYINLDGGEYCFGAPFALTNGSLIQDIRLAGQVVSTNNCMFSVTAGLVAYDMSTNSSVTSINNVHIAGASLQGSGETFTMSGGLIGITSLSGTASDNQNNFEGSINLRGSMSQQVSVGGLYGVMEGGTRSVNNSYANADIQINNTYSGESAFSIAGGLVGGIGLIEQDPTSPIFNNSYASGSINHSSTEPSNTVLLGGIAGVTTREISINNSFSHHNITDSQPGINGGVGGVIGALFGSDVRTYHNNYFDADKAGTTNCIIPLFDPIPGCTPISGQPGYFYNNTAKAPLDTWDFANIWETTSTLPVFGEKALTSITVIPGSRLTNRKPTNSVVNRSGQELVSAISSSLPSRIANKNTTVSEQDYGLFGTFKRFFNNIPETILVNFPYLLFALMLLATATMFVQVIIESRRLKATMLLIAKQTAIAEERDTFWHLAANYLRAPVTLMVGGIELMSVDKDVRSPAITKLEVLAKNLQKRVSRIMIAIEQSQTLQDIKRPKLETGRRVLGQLRFWLPVCLVAFFAILMNLLAKNYRNLSLSSKTLAIQVLVFLLTSVLFYWIMSALGIISRRRKQADKLLNIQSTTLDNARSDFVEQAATTLNKDLADLQTQLNTISKTAASASIVREGAQRLRTLIDSFKLLVAAQNNKLDSISPNSSHANIKTVMNEVLNSLQSIISQKHLKIVAPDLSSANVPGNAQLLSQVIGSVISNAVAFSPAGNTIYIDVKTNNNGTCLSVTNQGEPIEETQLSHVFNPLTTADGHDGLRLDHGGIGVNLYIDRLIMQHLGGGISITSGHSKGTTLTMSWPGVVESPT